MKPSIILLVKGPVTGMNNGIWLKCPATTWKIFWIRVMVIFCHSTPFIKKNIYIYIYFAIAYTFYFLYGVPLLSITFSNVLYIGITRHVDNNITSFQLISQILIVPEQIQRKVYSYWIIMQHFFHDKLMDYTSNTQLTTSSFYIPWMN